MDGSTLLEASPGSRPGPFDRSDPLKIQTVAPNEFGNHPWPSQRSIWHAPRGSLSSRTSDDQTSRPDSIRQKAVSSIHFHRSADGPSRASIDDHSRPATKTVSNPWPFSALSPADSRSRPPTKQANSPWHLLHDLNISSESSFLLQNSDPDIDPAAESKTRNGFSFDSHIALQGSNLLNSVRKGPGHSVDDSTTFSTGGSAIHSNTNSIGSIDNSVTAMSTSGRKMSGVDNDSPSTGQRFVSNAGGRRVSPASSQFTKTQHRDPLQMSTQQNLPFSVDTTADSFKNLSMSTPATRAQPSRGTSAGFPTLDAASSHLNHPTHPNNVAPNAPLPQLRLNSEPASFQPSLNFPLMSVLDVPDSNALYASYPVSWAAANAPGTPQSADYRNGPSLHYYSTGATPSTGRDSGPSGPSANGSALSSRSSSIRDFTLVDRKLGSVDSFQSPPHSIYASTSVPQYEFPASPNVRMNPLAGAYTPFGISTFSISAIPQYAINGRIANREPESVVGRSPVLEDFRAHQKTNKRYELRDIFGHVVEFSGDQHGSRFIQQKLETANSDEKDQIFKEIQGNCLQLMTDVFGNYVIQKLFEHGNQAQKKSLANHMKGHVLALSLQMYGCRVVQKALEHVLTDQQAGLVKELDGPHKQILKVIRDQNGNHVVQKAIERVPAEHIRFIIDAHRGEAVRLAIHTYGCRVIQRILENCDDAAKQPILDELYTCIPPLITDAFGNYVVQHIIEKGDPDGRRRVVSIVVQQALNFSKHKFASNVVEKCIDNADADQRNEILRRLVGPNEQGQTPVLGLLRDQYGNYVIQKVHSWLQGPDLDALVTEIKLCLPQLKRTSYGKQVMAIEKLLYGTPTTPSGTRPVSEEIASGKHAAPNQIAVATDHSQPPPSRPYQHSIHRMQQAPSLFSTMNAFTPA